MKKGFMATGTLIGLLLMALQGSIQDFLLGGEHIYRMCRS